MIAPKVVEELSLQPVTKIPFHSLDGLVFRPACLFNIGFYGDLRIENIDTDQLQPSRIDICTTVVVGGVLTNGTSFDVLIGMDIIRTWDLYFFRDGNFLINF